MYQNMQAIDLHIYNYDLLLNICQSTFPLHSPGVEPVTALKVRKKDDSVEKPDSAQIADIFSSGCRISNSLAYSTLYVFTN